MLKNSLNTLNTRFLITATHSTNAVGRALCKTGKILAVGAFVVGMSGGVFAMDPEFSGMSSALVKLAAERYKKSLVALTSAMAPDLRAALATDPRPYIAHVSGEIGRRLAELSDHSETLGTEIAGRSASEGIVSAISRVESIEPLTGGARFGTVQHFVDTVHDEMKRLASEWISTNFSEDDTGLEGAVLEAIQSVIFNPEPVVALEAARELTPLACSGSVSLSTSTFGGTKSRRGSAEFGDAASTMVAQSTPASIAARIFADAKSAESLDEIFKDITVTRRVTSASYINTIVAEGVTQLNRYERDSTDAAWATARLASVLLMAGTTDWVNAIELDGIDRSGLLGYLFSSPGMLSNVMAALSCEPSHLGLSASEGVEKEGGIKKLYSLFFPKRITTGSPTRPSTVSDPQFSHTWQLVSAFKNAARLFETAAAEQTASNALVKQANKRISALSSLQTELNYANVFVSALVTNALSDDPVSVGGESTQGGAGGIRFGAPPAYSSVVPPKVSRAAQNLAYEQADQRARGLFSRLQALARLVRTDAVELVPSAAPYAARGSISGSEVGIVGTMDQMHSVILALEEGIKRLTAGLDSSKPLRAAHRQPQGSPNSRTRLLDGHDGDLEAADALNTTRGSVISLRGGSPAPKSGCCS